MQDKQQEQILQHRQGLGQYQQALGQAEQGFEQAQLDATQIAEREAEFERFTRLGLVGQQLAQIQPGAFASTQRRLSTQAQHQLVQWLAS